MDVPHRAAWIRSSCLLLLLAVTFKGSQSQTEQCQSILQAINSTLQRCEAFGNCTGLRCQLLQPLSGASSFAVIQKCEDPITVAVEVNINAGAVQVQQQYQVTTEEQRRMIDSDLGTISVTTSRNDTYTNFMAMMLYQEDIALSLIPEVSVPLNTTDCSCQSLQDLASVIQSPIEHDCYNTSTCDGIRCELDVFGAVYYVEIVVLSCAEPTAFEVLVEDDAFQPLSVSIFNKTSQEIITVDGVDIVIDSTIIHHEYSVEIESEIVVPLFGRVPLIPRHTIILDRSMCSGSLTPPPPTVSTLPPVISIPPPSSNASETCVALYGIAIDAASEPFLCGLNRDCDELNCRLDILSTHYDIDISVKSCDSPPSILIAISDASGYFQGTVNLEDSTTFSVGIPEPNGTSVTVIIEEIDSAVRLKVDLVVSWPQNRVDSLIPYTDIPYDCQGSQSETEQCQSILQAIQSTFQICEALGNCTGLQCQLQQPLSGASSFAVIQKCEDPITVAVEVNINAGTVQVQQQYQVMTEEQRRMINSDLGTIFVTTSRNDTYMNFMAMMIYQGDIALSLIPEVSVPLNTTDCSCQSLQDLASVIQSPIVHDCYNTSTCDGVRCELDVFGTVYYVETVVLSCAEPTAFEVLVEDDTFQPLSESIFNRTSQEVITVDGVDVVIDSTIIHHEYSVEIESEIVVPLFGRIPLIPRHTIILDRSMCSGSLTPPPPTVSTLPPVISIPPPSSNASETCVALYGIAIDAASEPFVCGLNSDCDELNCRLDILSTHYDIDISVKSCDSPLSVLISDASGYLLGTVYLEDSTIFSVGIPEPTGTLVTVITEEIDGAVRLKIDLVVTWPQNRVDSLIPYSDIPYDCEVVCEQGAVRLVNGYSEYNGRLEMCVNEKWGTICDERFGSEEADATCGALGYKNSGAIPTSSAFFGEGEGSMYNSDESAASEQCSHRNDAGVFCQPLTADPASACKTGAVRLRGGSSDNEGRVEVCLNNQWGTVCDDSWDDTSAAVVCTQLNLPTGVTTAVLGAGFGQGTGIILDDVKCRGDETNILSCPQLQMNVPHNCRHSEDAGVQCMGTSQVSDTIGGGESDTVAIVVPTVLVVVLIITVVAILIIVVVLCRRQRSGKLFVHRAGEIPIVRAESFSSRTDSEAPEKHNAEIPDSPL